MSLMLFHSASPLKCQLQTVDLVIRPVTFTDSRLNSSSSTSIMQSAKPKSSYYYVLKFGMTRPGLESTTSCMPGKCSTKLHAGVHFRNEVSSFQLKFTSRPTPTLEATTNVVPLKVSKATLVVCPTTVIHTWQVINDYYLIN